MFINQRDFDELKRIATNTYDDDKRMMQRVILGITNMENEIIKLREELQKLRSSK